MECISREQVYCISLTAPFVEMGVGLFLYGVYTVLYTLCIYILATRKRNRYPVQVVLITALYVAATVEVGIKLVIYSSEVQIGVEVFADKTLSNHVVSLITQQTFIPSLQFGLQITTGVANILMDTLLLWRFYHTWGRTKPRVMIFPCIVAIAANVYGCVQTGAEEATHSYVNTTENKTPLVIFSICALVSNLILTGLI
ncbi:hypothetical protein PQX77_015808, partial [Marasmius sp. AFHP31]